MEVVWEDPPPLQPTSRAIWVLKARELSAHPGRWARVATDVDADYARQSVARQLRRAGCQVKTRTTTDDLLVSVWARWPQPCGTKGNSISTFDDPTHRESIVA